MNLITALSWLVSALTGLFVVSIWILATRKPEMALGPDGEASANRWEGQSSFLLKKTGPLIETAW